MYPTFPPPATFVGHPKKSSYILRMESPAVQHLLLPILAYFVGSFAFGYYVVKYKEGVDLRDKGDGSLGARNVYRLLGPVGFMVVALLDMAKGASVPLVVRTIDPTPWVTFASCGAAVLGHVLPLHLGFRGGKGVMTAVGTMLVLDPLLLAIIVGLLLPVLLVLRKLDLSGLIVVTFSPLIAYGLDRDLYVASLLAFFAVIILWAHRSVLKNELVRPSG